MAMVEMIKFKMLYMFFVLQFQHFYGQLHVTHLLLQPPLQGLPLTPALLQLATQVEVLVEDEDDIIFEKFQVDGEEVDELGEAGGGEGGSDGVCFGYEGVDGGEGGLAIIDHGVDIKQILYCGLFNHR